MNNSEDTTSLYIVSTPIGNMSDMTFRAVEVLKSVDFILAEDTRVSGKLLKHYDIKTKMISYNSHSKDSTKENVFKLIREGRNLALISDAGTPTISDPGVKIVSEIHEEFREELKERTIEITPIPGASAVLAALSVCGFPASEFIFYGFLPHKKGRQTIFKEITDNKKTSVFYESPNRLEKALSSILEFCGPDKKIFVAREITKMYEQKIQGTVSELIKYFAENPEKIRGEFVIVLDKK
jgi:16S rRNA (cytidine1402-2'-O)-methyltransferase